MVWQENMRIGMVMVTNEHYEETSACMTPLRGSRRSEGLGLGGLGWSSSYSRQKVIQENPRNIICGWSVVTSTNTRQGSHAVTMAMKKSGICASGMKIRVLT